MFEAFPKIPRLSRECVVTEKIDGTNAQIYIDYIELAGPDTFQKSFLVGDFFIAAGSRKRWITPDNDNFGFAGWVHNNAEELIKLGPGRHFGEWWGRGIQRGYGLDHKRFSLFNTGRWREDNENCLWNEDATIVPSCCHVVPVLMKCNFDTSTILNEIEELKENGSLASPNFMRPEGIIIYHKASNQLFKKIIEKDGEGKQP